MNLHKTAYLFDIDGVISDPQHKQVIEKELFTVLIGLLQAGNPLGFNTGRSLAWMSERVIEPLLRSIPDRSMLSRVIGIGEKGATWVTFDQTGAMHHGQDDAYRVPHAVEQRVKKLLQEKYADGMFFDETKETMVSIEMQDGFDLDKFHRKQKELVHDLEAMFANQKEQGQYTIDPTTIATDIEDKRVGKALGADRFLHFLSSTRIEVARFETFGDSVSDFPMSDELYERAKEVTMVFVGNRKKLGKITRPYPIVFSEGFALGTLAYLKSEKKG